MSGSATNKVQARSHIVLALLLASAVVLVVRVFYLHYQDEVDLISEGKSRTETKRVVEAHRGIITDRNGEPLAISAPMDTLVVKPSVLLDSLTPEATRELARLIDMPVERLEQTLQSRRSRGEFYLKRHLPPDVTARIEAIRVPVANKNRHDGMAPLSGIEFRREYRRFYPMGEVASQLVGFTGVDNQGLAGLEYGYNALLKGENGEKRVLLANNPGRDVVALVDYVKEPRDGQDLVLSIERRVQYLAYRELKAAVTVHEAESASAVLLDTRTGEVLALVNQPSFNPNDLAQIRQKRYQKAHRNGALLDVFEPGSTVKPFTIAAALQAGVISPQTIIDTTPGMLRVGGKTIRDAANYGPIDPRTILMKSSNVGASKVALSLTAEQLWKFFDRLGFGVDTASHFPGEADGATGDYWKWPKAQQAAFSYGYGLDVTALQLARAYSVLANDGVLKPVSLLKIDEIPAGERVMSAEVAATVRTMLEAVVSPEGTGKLAQVKDYRIAGKTGTVHRLGRRGYDEDNFSALFAGIAPASQPRLALVVVVHGPQRSQWHGGAVAAPVFSRIMAGALRLLNIPPDNLEPGRLRAAGLHFDDSYAAAVNNGGRG